MKQYYVIAEPGADPTALLDLLEHHLDPASFHGLHRIDVERELEPMQRVVAYVELCDVVARIVIDLLKGFESNQYSLVQPPVSVEAAPRPAGDILTNAEKALLADDPAAADTSLKALLTSPASGIAFPEQDYTGPKKILHQALLRELNPNHPVAVWQDQGAIITEAQVNSLKRGDHPEQLFDEIIEDMLNELQAFGQTRRYFGGGGHYQEFWQNQTIANGLFLHFVNDTYFKVDTGAEAELLMDLIIRGTAVLIGLSGPDGKFAAACMQAIWGYAVKKALVGRSLKGTLSDLQKKLSSDFQAMLTATEMAHAELNTDWGKLSVFKVMVDKGEVYWPNVTDKIRAAAAVGFQRSAVQAILPHYDYGHIVCETEHAKAHAKREFDPANGQYSLMTHAEYEPWYKVAWYAGWWRNVYYLGKLTAEPNRIYGKPAPTNTQAKLFGRKQSDPSDPELNLGAGFYLKNPWHLHRNYISPFPPI